MKQTHFLLRALFLLLFLLLGGFYAEEAFLGLPAYSRWVTGAGIGLGLGFAAVWMMERLVSYGMKGWVTFLLGAFLGLLLGGVFRLIISIFFAPFLTFEGLQAIQTLAALFCLYLGMGLVYEAASSVALELPFVRFRKKEEQARDILLDLSVLCDSRVLDLASSGILDRAICIPRFFVDELERRAAQATEEGPRARKALEVLKKLEQMSVAGVRYWEEEAPQGEGLTRRLLRLAAERQALFLTADISRLQQSDLERVHVVNLHQVANALKPLAQSGELLEVKVQRYGKEPKQGVGYLEDGTMVVVNGGSDYIGEAIFCRVLSVKHTSSGRMIFCNTLDESAPSHDSQREAPPRRRYATSSS